MSMSLSRVRLRFLPLVVCAVALAASLGCRGESPSPGQTAGAPAAAPVQQDPSAPPARPKIVTLGDSLTAGYGLLETQSYPAVLQQRIDADGYAFEVSNAGVSGDTSAGALRRLDWALEGDVRVVVVALGGNDGLRGLSAADMKRNLTSIVERAKARRVAVILAGMEAPPNYGPEYVAAFRQVFREVALEQRVLFIPFLLQGVAGRSELNLPDGIHPNATGAAKVADTVWGVLRPLLDQMTDAS